ncbi:MAG: hypothetical protein M3471_04340 [Actinomycetota bacterium]|nr:hypothetical protein [Actinomycetota bacterium]
MAGAVGRGLFAGAVGTAAMTISSTVEMKVRGRQASSALADAAAKVLGIEPTGDAPEGTVSSVVDWYGSGWDVARGLLGAVGLGGPAAGAAHLGVVWGSELVKAWGKFSQQLPAIGVGFLGQQAQVVGVGVGPLEPGFGPDPACPRGPGTRSARRCR